ncbi:MAG: cytochrome c [Rhodospirillales bacterium]|nr:cytochrome c [Rhodospirillales bacterium]
MKTLIKRLALIALVAGFMPVPGPVSAADLSIIDKRIDVMKNVVLKNLKVIKGYVKEGKGTPADVATAAAALAVVAPKIPGLFPEDTGRPEVDAKKTRALPDIWLDFDKFRAVAKTLETEAKKLSKVAMTGDKGAIAAQFGAMGKKGCGGCHKPFRGDKVK